MVYKNGSEKNNGKFKKGEKRINKKIKKIVTEVKNTDITTWKLSFYKCSCNKMKIDVKNTQIH